MNIVLTGFMSTGKSTVGKILAKRLGWPFYDTDAMIEKQTGHTIVELFSKGGEAAFRDMESQAVGLVALLDKAVIATGGGVPLRAENMDQLEKNGAIVCLTAMPETVLARVSGGIGSRPLIKGPKWQVRFEELQRHRQQAYARCKAAVATDGRTPEEVADQVMAAVPEAKA